MKIQIGFFVLLLSFAAIARPLPYLASDDFTPYWPGETSKETRTAARVGAFRLENQNGNAITENSLRGHLSLVSFFFSECSSVCPLLMGKIQLVQKELGSSSNLRFYSLSITPGNDTPEKLRDFARRRHLALGNWDLVTGDQIEIYRVGREYFRADKNPKPGAFVHSENAYLIDSQLRIRGIYQIGNPSTVDRLVQDVRELSAQAGVP